MPGNRTGPRRGNDEGTVYFDKRRKRYRARYVLLDGRRPEVSGKTAAECRAKLDAARRDRDAGMPAPTDRPKVRDWLEYWLANEVPSRCRPGTAQDYASIVHCHLIPALGRIRLIDLRPQHVQRLLNNLHRDGRSPATVVKVRAVLRRALTRAEAMGKVSRNVAKLVEPPPLTERLFAVPTPAEVKQLLVAFAGDELGPLITVAATTGLRRGETLGLAWTDLEGLDGPGVPRLHVRYQLQRVGGQLERVEPKTRSSRRTVALSLIALAALRQQQAAQDKTRLAAGKAWRDNGLVFTNATGGGLDGEAVYKRFRRHLASHGLRPITWHSLRHCYASLQAAEGATLQEIMHDLGHTDVRTTLRYAHLLPGARQASADRIGRALGGPEGAESGQLSAELSAMRTGGPP